MAKNEHFLFCIPDALIFSRGKRTSRSEEAEPIQTILSQEAGRLSQEAGRPSHGGNQLGTGWPSWHQLWSHLPPGLQKVLPLLGASPKKQRRGIEAHQPAAASFCPGLQASLSSIRRKKFTSMPPPTHSKLLFIEPSSSLLRSPLYTPASPLTSMGVGGRGDTLRESSGGKEGLKHINHELGPLGL